MFTWIVGDPSLGVKVGSSVMWGWEWRSSTKWYAAQLVTYLQLIQIHMESWVDASFRERWIMFDGTKAFLEIDWNFDVKDVDGDGRTNAFEQIIIWFQIRWSMKDTNNGASDEFLLRWDNLILLHLCLCSCCLLWRKLMKKKEYVWRHNGFLFKMRLKYFASRIVRKWKVHSLHYHPFSHSVFAFPFIVFRPSESFDGDKTESRTAYTSFHKQKPIFLESRFITEYIYCPPVDYIRISQRQKHWNTESTTFHSSWHSDP